ncbi:hypothetical protein AFLA_010757 [Aspergillus flavus NRRL3357]|nr:hypothetical protein AFLA_010757 [Aspergillus flavus NRRL3357]
MPPLNRERARSLRLGKGAADGPLFQIRPPDSLSSGAACLRRSHSIPAKTLRVHSSVSLDERVEPVGSVAIHCAVAVVLTFSIGLDRLLCIMH